MKITAPACLGTFCLAVNVAACVAAYANEEPKGSVVTARVAPQAVLIWNASPAVADLVAQKTVGEDGLKTLELDGIDILATRAHSLKAKSIQLRIIYEQSGAVSPVYGGATFGGYERVMTLVAMRSEITKDAAQWAKDISTGDPPKGLVVTVTGRLPPTQ